MICPLSQLTVCHFFSFASGYEHHIIYTCGLKSEFVSHVQIAICTSVVCKHYSLAYLNIASHLHFAGERSSTFTHAFSVNSAICFGHVWLKMRK